ncbi:MAG: hypothetical protein HY587_07890 [Candidatus Omnitrophica bacterium]|nr:hypothetical protein [Candidatus Omnitrophota bacterium]
MGITEQKPQTRWSASIGFLLLIALPVLLLLPEAFQFPAKTRVLQTRNGLEHIRERIGLFSRHHGRAPHSLSELLTETYETKGSVREPYLEKIPIETISSQEGTGEFVDVLNTQEIHKPGGWMYQMDLGEIHVNVHKKLDKRWGEFRGEIPSNW